jgi:hypothetical protein
MTVTEIIRNTMTDMLGHRPDKFEQEKFISYIHDEISDRIHQGKDVRLVDIEHAMNVCLDECFHQCEGCGEWFLPEEMHDRGYECLNCHPYFDPDDWKDEPAYNI